LATENHRPFWSIALPPRECRALPIRFELRGASFVNHITCPTGNRM
jgi:hypothetical protein